MQSKTPNYTVWETHCHQLIIHAKLIAHLEAGVKTCLYSLLLPLSYIGRGNQNHKVAYWNSWKSQKNIWSNTV